MNSQSNSKILILGASGMLGHQMWRFFCLSDVFDVTGTVRKNSEYYKSQGLTKTENLIQLNDIQDFDALTKILIEVKPHFIINCIGLTLRKKDLQDIEKCYHINATLPRYLSLWCEQNNSKLIHFSTDCVFNGKKGTAYTEADLPTAFDHYGQSKFLGEVGSPNLTLRLSILGQELSGAAKTELIEWVLSQKNNQINGYTQVIYSGLTTRFIAREVYRLILDYPGLKGLYHIASEPISKFEIIQKMNLLFNLNLKLEKKEDPVSNKTLNCDFYTQKTGFKKPNWDQMLDDLFSDRLFYERPA